VRSKVASPESNASGFPLFVNVASSETVVVARESVYGEPAYALPSDPSDPAYDARQNILRERARSTESIYGTAYLWTAGLMNLLLLLDVWDIARGRKD